MRLWASPNQSAVYTHFNHMNFSSQKKFPSQQRSLTLDCKIHDSNHHNTIAQPLQNPKFSDPWQPQLQPKKLRTIAFESQQAAVDLATGTMPSHNLLPKSTVTDNLRPYHHWSLHATSWNQALIPKLMQVDLGFPPRLVPW